MDLPGPLPQLPQRIKPRSIWARQLVAASLSLFAFLMLAGITLDHTFRVTAESDMQRKLASFADALTSQSEISRSGSILPPLEERMPSPDLNQPGSGQYARIATEDSVWVSPSSSGPILPAPELVDPGTNAFRGPVDYEQIDGTQQRLYIYSVGVMRPGNAFEQTPDVRYTVQVIEDSKFLTERVQLFRRTLIRALGLAGLVLLILQAMILRWSIMPLGKLVTDLKRVESGESSKLSDSHPTELQPLANAINSFIDTERQNIERQRTAMDNLSHSLKTPIAVLRTMLDSEVPADDLRSELATQLTRMNDQISYRLTRASAGHKLFAAGIEIEPSANDIVNSLEKLHPKVVAGFEIDPSARFFGEIGDLQELLGNLLENAFKWSRSSVLLTVARESRGKGNTGLLIQVEDNGPGIEPSQVESVLQRGVRGDQRVKGHGIGLAIVQELVDSYGGTLTVTRSEDPELGGACFSVRFPKG